MHDMSQEPKMPLLYLLWFDHAILFGDVCSCVSREGWSRKVLYIESWFGGHFGFTIRVDRYDAGVKYSNEKDRYENDVEHGGKWL